MPSPRRWLPVVLIAAATLCAAVPAAAQVGVSARIGTLGVGGEIAVDLSDRWVARGGVGLRSVFGLAVLPQPETTLDSIPFELRLPTRWLHLGFDYYLHPAFRVGAGAIFKSASTAMEGRLDEAIDLGGRIVGPSEVGALTGTIDSGRTAAYGLVGFGRHTLPGVSLSLDAGLAWLGTPSVTLDARGGSLTEAELAPLLTREAREFEDNMKPYFRVWPILGLGLQVAVW